MKFHPNFAMALILLMQTNLCSTDNRLNYVTTVDEYTNTCPIGLHHKATPHPEPEDKNLFRLVTTIVLFTRDGRKDSGTGASQL
ncbi:hypothetical protein AHF37_11520 [Paragonimus kellicotti]|nr:hypothetical protein AHF37_11520 [Paragonimus kellicotti]